MTILEKYVPILLKGMSITNSLLELFKEQRDEVKAQAQKEAETADQGQKMVRNAMKGVVQPLIKFIQSATAGSPEFLKAKKVGVAITVETIVDTILLGTPITHILMQKLLLEALGKYKNSLQEKQLMEEADVDLEEFDGFDLE